MFSKITRMHFGVRISPFFKNDEDEKCTKCNNDIDLNGVHALICKYGNNGSIYRHNEINKFLCKLIDKHTRNYIYEPKKIDDDTLERPDIVVHDKFKMLNGKYCKFYVDTMITSIYNKRNVDDLLLNNFGYFNAGKYAEEKERRDYMDKFQNLQESDYYFIPAILESSGGINKELRFLINNLIKELYPREKHGVMIHNYYIELSIKLKKLIYDTLYDHYSLI